MIYNIIKINLFIIFLLFNYLKKLFKEFFITEFIPVTIIKNDLIN